MTIKIADDLKLGGPSAKSVFTRVALTPEQTKAWNQTRSRFLFQCPAFSKILYDLMKVDGGNDVALFVSNPEVWCAATDGRYLILRPEQFFKYDLLERTFIVAHEVLHNMFSHCELTYAMMKRGVVKYPDGTELPFISSLMNMAQDYIINDMLIQSKVGKFNADWLHDTNIATQDSNAVDVYRKLYEAGGGAGAKGRSFDVILKPGAGRGEAAEHAVMSRSPVAWKQGIAAAMAIGRLQGDASAKLNRHFMDILEPKVDWRDHIKALFARKVGNGGFDWRRPDRRLITRSGNLGDPIFAPGRSGNGCDTIVVGCDTSGSIGEAVLDAFFAEISGILEELRPKRILLMWCDAQVHEVIELEDATDLARARSEGAKGGGGTSFIPVFKEVDSMGVTPDALVYLTDGYGAFPDREPPYPVIWGNISGDRVKYPFGDVVHVEL